MPVQLEDVDPAVRAAEYAVRGPIVARAQELFREGRRVVFCNIGNPQALGQLPLTWVRQVLALSECPELLERVPPDTFPEDVVEVARHVVRQTAHGLGAYTESEGMRFVREAVAEFIRDRDRIPASADAVYLTDGASKGAQSVLRILIANRRDGILIPIPQYPLYSATVTLYGGAQVGYHLDEARGWKLSLESIRRASDRAAADGIRLRAIVVINPGNPTGAVLDEGNVEAVLRFASERGIAVLADEVYQENLHRPGSRFVSFAKVLEKLGMRDVSLFSMHSVSKGILGECGHRGGYLEYRNLPSEVAAQLTKLQSISLCANTAGQIVTYLMVKPPTPGDPSFERYATERRAIEEALRLKAQMVADGLNAIPGIECNPAEGAMYAFPKITLPPGVTDSEYCLALLEETGLCVVPGSGFGQAPGTSHFRTTILPPAEEVDAFVKGVAEFHVRFCARRGG